METTRKKTTKLSRWDMSAAERLAVLRRAKAVWSKRKIDPIKELQKIRREWH